jgi:hypothetical protein
MKYSTHYDVSVDITHLESPMTLKIEGKDFSFSTNPDPSLFSKRTVTKFDISQIEIPHDKNDRLAAFRLLDEAGKGGFVDYINTVMEGHGEISDLFLGTIHFVKFKGMDHEDLIIMTTPGGWPEMELYRFVNGRYRCVFHSSGSLKNISYGFDGYTLMIIPTSANLHMITKETFTIHGDDVRIVKSESYDGETYFPEKVVFHEPVTITQKDEICSAPAGMSYPYAHEDDWHGFVLSKFTDGNGVNWKFVDIILPLGVEVSRVIHVPSLVDKMIQSNGSAHIYGWIRDFTLNCKDIVRGERS